VSSNTSSWSEPPYYPDCKHPAFDARELTCIYCGKQLTQEEVDEGRKVVGLGEGGGT
jgi:hypothetical protein